MPTPKWKLVVDIGTPSKPEADAAGTSSVAGPVDNRANDLLLLVRTYTPADKNSPLAIYLPGFTSLRLLLEKSAKTPREEELAQTLIESYTSYFQSGRIPSDVAWMVARDYMVLSQHQQLQQQQQQLSRRTSFPLGISQGESAMGGVGFSGSNAVTQFGSNPNSQHHQMYAQSQTAQQQVLPHLSLQQLTQYEYPQQLPGQPSA